jgi:hypothetical protein
MEVAEAKKLRDLERENDELKKRVAERSLDNRVLKELNSKRMMSPADRCRGAEHLEKVLGVSERRACQGVAISRTTKRRPSGRIEENEWVCRAHERSERYPRFDRDACVVPSQNQQLGRPNGKKCANVTVGRCARALHLRVDRLRHNRREDSGCRDPGCLVRRRIPSLRAILTGRRTPESAR